MGKRTIGEMQPYEFVITLVVADLAVTPMQEISVPLLYGLVPLFIVFAAHYLITALTSKSIKLRKLINGKPFVIIDGNGINLDTLSKLSMDVNDVLSLIRQQGYFSPAEIAYAVIETNGKLSILENSDAESPKTVPMTLIVEGKTLHDNASRAGLDDEKILKVLSEQGLNTSDVLLMTAESTNFFIQPKEGKYITLENVQL